MNNKRNNSSVLHEGYLVCFRGVETVGFAGIVFNGLDVGADTGLLAGGTTVLF
jgi:hypothetical protein